ncbi:MAG: restriction endonuclease subunit S [Clostridia bacterium]|nr:restriction endonuclease subunit S [Clostridia bacterium]
MSYSKYKAIESLWVSSLPEHWGYQETKRLMRNIGSGTTPPTTVESYYGGDIHWIQSGDLYKRIRVLQTQKMISSQAIKACSALSIYKKPFLVVAMYGASIGNVAISEIDACVNQACCVLQPSEKVALCYLLYWYIFGKEFLVSLSAGGTQPNISQAKIRDFCIAIPPRDEQDQIVRFLDWKVSEINRLIGLKRKQVKLLQERKDAVVVDLVLHGVDAKAQMRDSGSFWLGSVPSQWKVTRGKNLFKEIDVRSETGTEELLTVSHITGITPRRMKNVTMFKSESLVGYKKCKPGQIAANTMWMWQGAIAVSSYDGVISPSYNTYEQRNNDFIPEYLDRMLRIRPLVNNYVVLSSGIRKSRLRLYPEQFLTILFPVPPKEEQRTIVDAIHKQTGQIDQAIEMEEKEITLLQELKIRLISDVVTGKMDVRSIEIPEYEYVADEAPTEETEEETEECEE